ncbi:DUF2496 domain-containing protein [Marinomonas hwangdonensis]|uniref:DUF2496 domain-containing protein n=1 Tax=Marinomonas hwangdonensis TaxID=1053647 RepID=A0A3M8PZ76_9GAMM|nr:YbaM family protein [Marinomonas hwangdonensis]RNF49227.1 DUF2496 domain-containing protein [Marinomonas hwangdonensis]
MSSLDFAPDHVKLAVDLIELLESNHVEVDVAVDALTLVLHDFERKQESSRLEKANLPPNK